MKALNFGLDVHLKHIYFVIIECKSSLRSEQNNLKTYMIDTLILDAGADFSVKSAFGKTAADMSEATDNKQIAKMIGELKRILHEEQLQKMTQDGDGDTLEIEVPQN